MSSFEKDKYKFSLHKSNGLVSSDTIEERKRQAIDLIEELMEYNVLLKDLVSDLPSYSIRNTILNISYSIIQEVDIYEYIDEKKRLPIAKLVKMMPIGRNFFEEWKDYILAYLIIISNPKYKDIQDYLSVEENINILGADEIRQNKDVSEYQGLVICKKRKNAIILTSNGEFKIIVLNEDMEVGEEAIGSEKKTLKHYKLQASILLALITFTIIILGFSYKFVRTTLIIQTTSEIRVDVNRFNRIVKVISPTDKGQEMIKKLSVVDNDLDSSLYDMFKYIEKNEMIPQDGIVITVIGHAIEYGTLSKTEKLIEDNDMDVKFNNSGNEHKFNP
ncbi:anti-sigma factor domain-containing protein [Clostridium sp.]|uniref:anti-sigma factor domain-containing protein n=1 Tax=Clostridium sp. TaxID=1506 RepID=UPI003F384A54